MTDYRPDWDSDDLDDFPDPVDREAALWFGIMRADEVPPTAQAEFLAWLERSPEHEAAYLDLERIWEGASELVDLHQLPTTRSSISRRVFVIGGLALLGGGASFAYLRHFPFADFQTGTGERRVVVLADGSTATLSADSAFSLDFSAAQRLVTLLRGEVYFDVAADAARPFSVLAGNGRTTALGTAFSVALQPHGAVVTVTEHRVEVDLGGRTERVGEGHQIAYMDEELGPITVADPATSLAWLEGRIIFISQPLQRVVDALNRWRGGQLVIMDAALAQREVTVVVDIEKSDDILGQLENALPIRTTGMTPLLTLIFPA